MDGQWLGLIELLLVLGGVLGLALWDLRATHQDGAGTPKDRTESAKPPRHPEGQ